MLQVETTKDTRASVEAKPAFMEVDAISASRQVGHYLDHYGLCLVTNLREFALVRKAKNGKVETIMRYMLAPTEAALWQTPVDALAREHTDGLMDFLKSALTWDAPISRPKDLADALARYAREALRRLERQPSTTLAPLRAALSEALGLHFNEEEGEHFFRSSLVQTFFYGLFSAWVVWSRNNPGAEPEGVRWREAGDYLSLPVMRELFERIAIPGQLEMLDIRKPLEWAEATLRRTGWAAFESAFEQGDAVNYFYEPFLEAYDPELREQLGVWYTPREIIRYQVARVDRLLREELQIADGLADERVVVLDPATGTGGYVLEVFRVIDEILQARGAGAMRGIELRNAATKRVFGFEILPAPFVVAHLQVATLLADRGATLGKEQRVGIYLTNSLTGWKGEEIKQLVLPEYPALASEAEAATKVKQGARIIVVLGNPPYRGQAGVAEDEESDLIAPYYIGLTERFDVQAQGLNDLYVRFLRLAERQIAETTGLGIVSFITNSSWLDGLSHPIMREHMLTAFEHIWIDNLHGGGRFKGSRGPDGKPDRSVFEYVGGQGSMGITVPTAITTMVKTRQGIEKLEVFYRDVWGQGYEKRKRLQDDAALDISSQKALYRSITPSETAHYILTPGSVNDTYTCWPALDEMFVNQYPGVKTSRDSDLVSIDRDTLSTRMQRYFRPDISDEQMEQYAPALMTSASRFNAATTRQDLLRTSRFREERLVPYAYRSLDNRRLYWEDTTKLLDEKRADYFEQIFPGNLYLEVIRHQRKAGLYDHGIVLGNLMDLNFVDGGGRCFPLYIRGTGLFEGKQANFKEEFMALIEKAYGEDTRTLEDVFYHIASMLNTPAYRTENAGAIESDWPRIPIPATREQLTASAELGRKVGDLLRPDVQFKPGPEVRGLGGRREAMVGSLMKVAT